jgi:hypothetical protein
VSTPNLFIQLQAILAVSNQLNQIPPYIVNYDFGNPQQSATVQLFESFLQAVTAGVTLQLPQATVYCVLVQNISSSGTLLRVTHTPSGQAASQCTLGQNGIFCYFDPTETGGGITALTLTGIAATCPAMVFVGG